MDTEILMLNYQQFSIIFLVANLTLYPDVYPLQFGEILLEFHAGSQISW